MSELKQNITSILEKNDGNYFGGYKELQALIEKEKRKAREDFVKELKKKINWHLPNYHRHTACNLIDIEIKALKEG